MSSPPPTPPLILAYQATKTLAAAIAAQQAEHDPNHEDFYGYGTVLTGVLARLAELAALLGHQIAHYGDARILRDDTGGDPARRLAAATGHLQGLWDALALAEQHAQRYWAEVGHIAVVVDPEGSGGHEYW